MPFQQANGGVAGACGAARSPVRWRSNPSALFASHEDDAFSRLASGGVDAAADTAAGAAAAAAARLEERQREWEERTREELARQLQEEREERAALQRQHEETASRCGQRGSDGRARGPRSDGGAVQAGAPAARAAGPLTARLVQPAAPPGKPLV
jgi:hypothetical protein